MVRGSLLHPSSTSDSLPCADAHSFEMYRLFHVSSFCFLLSLYFPATQQAAFAGPFQMLVKKVANCEDTGQHKIYVTNIRVKKTGLDTLLYEGNLTSLVEAGDDIEGKMVMYQVKNGEKKQFFIHEFSHVCQEVKKYFPELYEDMLSSAGVESCPFPAKTYDISSNICLKFSDSAPKSLPYGDFIMENQLLLNGEVIGCFEYTVTFLKRDGEKKKKKKN